MPTYETFIKASGSYCVIKVYRDDPNPTKLTKFLEENGWNFNGTATFCKPRGFLKTLCKENKEWAKSFCENPEEHIELTKKKAEELKKEREKLYGKEWHQYTDEELKTRIDNFLKKRQDYDDYLYAQKYLNLSDRTEKEIRFLGMKFDDDGCVLRFWLSDDTFHIVEPAYVVYNNYRIRTKGNKIYFISGNPEDTDYHYTLGRHGVIYSFHVSEERGFPYEEVGCLEIIFAVCRYENFLYYTKKMILEYDAYAEEFELSLDSNNYFSSEESMYNSTRDGSSNNGQYEYYNAVMDTSGWSAESYLMQVGYSVSKKEGLSDREREDILANVLDSKKMSKIDIIEHIERQINLRKNNSSYDLAVSKWEKDLQFIHNYH